MWIGSVRSAETGEACLAVICRFRCRRPKETELAILWPTKTAVQSVTTLTKNRSKDWHAANNHSHIDLDFRPQDKQREVGNEIKVILFIIGCHEIDICPRNSCADRAVRTKVSIWNLTLTLYWMRWERTYNIPTINTLVTPIFFLTDIFNFQMIGTGINMITKSVRTSVPQKTVSIFSVSVHSVRKNPIGAQFQSQCVPHWNKVAKKKDILQAATIPIITQHNSWKERMGLSIRFHSSKMEVFISPKAIFSVVWKAYLYFWTRTSSALGWGQLLRTIEWPVIAPCITPERKIPFKARTKNCSSLYQYTVAVSLWGSRWTHKRRQSKPVIKS